MEDDDEEDQHDDDDDEEEEEEIELSCNYLLHLPRHFPKKETGEENIKNSFSH